MMRFVFFFLFLFIIIEGKKPVKRTVTTVVREVPKGKITASKSYRSHLLPKQVSDYEQCKLECRKLRDRVELEEYVQKLKDELADVEQRVADEDKVREQEAIEIEEQDDNVITRTAKAAKRMVSNAVHKVTGNDDEEEYEPKVVKTIKTTSYRDGQ